MASATEAARLGEILKWEEDNQFSRDKVTVVSGQNLTIGEVVGKITANGKYAEHDPDGSDGTETAAGVLTAACDASAADKEAVIIARDAIVMSSKLAWQTGIQASEKTAALVELAALGIITRDEA